MLKVICAGLPRTGNTSLAEALRILGYKTLQHSTDRLPLFPTADTSFLVFDDVDAVVDLPAAMYWEELSEAYPEAKVILTTRLEDEWYRSIVRHIEVMRAAGDPDCDMLHTLVFGTAEPSEYWYKRRLHEHEASVRLWAEQAGEKESGMYTENFLAISFADGPFPEWSQREASDDSWHQLCTFLDKPIPDVPFPWLNKGELNEV